MVQRKHSDVEKATIKAQTKLGMNHEQIAGIVGGNRSTATNYLASLTNPKQPKKLDRPPQITRRQKCAIQSAVLLEQPAKTIRKTKTEVCL